MLKDGVVANNKTTRSEKMNGKLFLSNTFVRQNKYKIPPNSDISLIILIYSILLKLVNRILLKNPYRIRPC